MCGRFTLTVSLEELLLRYMIEGEALFSHRPRYNITVSQPAPVILSDGQRNRIWEMSFLLDPEIRGSFNARSETIDQKPTFRQAFFRRRCLIPADGYYERDQNDAGKPYYRVVMKDRKLFSMAGIYNVWVGPDGKKSSSFAIVTTEPNELVRGFHHRMPVILRPEDEAVWLDRGNQDAARLKALLKPYAAGEMEAYRVSDKVGNWRNDSPDLIAEVKK